ncbi:MAG: Protease HtpX [Pseudomonadota bacterium]|jgi:heat shock protein HtpX
MFGRILLFLATNILVIATISIVTNLLGLHSYLTAHGINYLSLAIFCALWGTAGAFISLFTSKFIAKKSMGVHIIDPDTAIGEEKNILELIHQLARKAGLKTLPEVGIYNSPELNAFATGPSKNNSLLAVSSGLLDKMNRDQIEGVLGHEITHITNGDMVTMTLILGIINAFALFLSRLVAYVISVGAAGRNNNEGTISGPGPLFFMLSMVFDILFTFLGSILVAAFSRHREYRADKGGAILAGRDNMIAALQVLKKAMEPEDTRAPSLATLKISHKSSGFRALFSSHPPLELRIARLQKGE